MTVLMNFDQICDAVGATRKGNEHRADCTICGNGHSMTISPGHTQPAVFKCWNCEHRSEDIHEWAKDNIRGYWQKKKAPAVTEADATSNNVSEDNTPGGDPVKAFKQSLREKEATDTETMRADAEALAAGYGLTWADYEAAGCTVKPAFFPSLNQQLPAICYPVILHDGTTTRRKYKTLARFVDKEGRMKRHSAYDKCRLPKTWQGARQGLFPTALSKKVQVCWICGGEEKALLLMRLGYVAFVYGNDARELPVEIARLLLQHFSNFGFIFDQGEGNAEACSQSLYGAAFDSGKSITTMIAEWPKDRPRGHDPNDEITQHGEQSLRTILESARLYAPAKPVIIESPSRDVNVVNVLRCLAMDGKIFHRGNEVLVRYRAGSISPISVHVIPEKVAANSRWMKQLKDGSLVQKDIDERLAKNIHTRGDFSPEISEINGVVNYPLLRADGSIHQADGYDAETGYWLCSREQWNVPEAPDLDCLLEPLQDFPFASDNHRSAAIAAALTIVTRHLINGSTPAFAIDASQAGSGKGLLTKVIARLTIDKSDFDLMGLHRDDDENEKMLVSQQKKASTVLCFDNIEGAIISPVLCRLITTPNFTGRLLGLNIDTGGMTWQPVVLFNGNNLSFKKDIVRRVITTRIVPTTNLPQQREFRINDLLIFVQRNRKRLLENLLAIVRQYLLAGRSPVTTTAYGSFSEWTDLVCASIIYAGLPDPNTNVDVRDGVHDPHEIGFGLLMDWLIQRKGSRFALKDLFSHVNRGDNDLKEAICELADNDGIMPTAQKLGIILAGFKDNVHDGFYLVCDPADRKGIKHWHVKPVPNVAECSNTPYRRKTDLKTDIREIGSDIGKSAYIGTSNYRQLSASPPTPPNFDICPRCKKPIPGTGWSGACSVECAAAIARGAAEVLV